MSTHSTKSTTSAPQSLDTITASLVARQSRTDDGSMSVPDQIQTMTEWCAKQTPPIEVGGVYTEFDISGRKPLAKRKGLLSAVVDVEEGRSQMVLTAYFDRFVRSVSTRAEVLIRVEENHGGTVMTMDFGKTSNASPVSKFTGTVLAAAAEMIAEQAGERTAVTKQTNIDKGVPPFPHVTPAYQRREDGTLEPHPVNGPIVREACELRLSGMSYTKIAQFLTANGIPMTVSGTEHMLSSPLLYGEIRFGKFRANERAIDDPIISRGFARRMHAAKATRGRYAKSERLLARQGVLVCKTCGARLSVHESKPSGDRVYAYYRCGNRAVCSDVAAITCDEAEEIVRDAAIELTGKRIGRASMERELEVAREEADAAQTTYDRAIRILLGHADETAARDELDELARQRDAAQERHAHLLTRTTPDLTVRTLDDWADLKIVQQRRIIRATIARAVVAPGRGPGRITIEPR